MSSSQLLTDARPWLDILSTPLSVVATALSIYGTLVARAARRRLTITGPDDGEVHQEYGVVSGIGARPRWRVLVLSRTNQWYLQKGAAAPSKHGSWVHEQCHFHESTLNKERTVVALAVPPKAVEILRQAFGGWGPEGNKNRVEDWDALLNLLDGLRVRYVVSDPRRIRRVA
jgi:hypothetical protein